MVEKNAPTNTPTSVKHFSDSFTFFIPAEQKAKRGGNETEKWGKSN